MKHTNMVKKSHIKKRWFEVMPTRNQVGGFDQMMSRELKLTQTTAKHIRLKVLNLKSFTKGKNRVVEQQEISPALDLNFNSLYTKQIVITFGNVPEGDVAKCQEVINMAIKQTTPHLQRIVKDITVTQQAAT